MFLRHISLRIYISSETTNGVDVLKTETVDINNGLTLSLQNESYIFWNQLFQATLALGRI